MKDRIRNFNLLSKDYGLLFTIKYYFLRKTKRYDDYIELVCSKLVTILGSVINKYQSLDKDSDRNGKEENPNKIWVCWWQGREYMPLLCEICYKRLLDVLPDGYEVILITKDNFVNYIEIPDIILRKLELGSLRVTQFSDILREGLLYYHGGVWLDASIWVNENFIDTIDTEAEFWSVKLNGIYDPSIWGQQISQCRWSGFVLYGKKSNIVSDYVYHALCSYFSRYDSTIDYHIHNMTIKLGADKIDYIGHIINSISPSNEHVYDLHRLMNKPYDENKWRQLCNDTAMFKLTQKRQYEERHDGIPTFYSYLNSLVN